MTTNAETDGCTVAVEAAAGRALGLHDDLGWALATVLRSYLRTSDTVLSDLPGGARGYRLLASVAHASSRSQLALAQHTGLDRTVVTYLLDDLSAAGLVERQADPDDRRTRRVVATDAGRRRLSELDTLLRRVEEHVLGDLSPTDSAQFRCLVQRVALGIGQRDEQGMTCGEIEQLKDC